MFHFIPFNIENSRQSNTESEEGNLNVAEINVISISIDKNGNACKLIPR